jgi:hypothetical protein
MQRAGMNWQDIDIVECNEAFASVPMAWLAEIDYLRTLQSEWRRHFARPSDRCQRRAHYDYAAARAGAHGWPLRIADDVRGRWRRQRHHHRADELNRYCCWRRRAPMIAAWSGASDTGENSSTPSWRRASEQ